MKTIRAAAIQIAPDLGGATGTIDRMLRAIAEAADAGVELAVFPESFVPYYPYFSFVEPPFASGKAHQNLYREAVVIPGPLTERLSRAAASYRMVLVVGVNELDGGSLYNTQLIYNSDGSLLLKRRKITPTFHERMVWGQGDGSGLRAVDSAVGRIGALACWEHYNPLARYTLMADREEIHCAQFPGSMVGQVFADQIEVTIRHHALEAGCFVVNSTGWLSDEQIAQITPDPAKQKALRGGCFSAIIAPDGSHLCEPITTGEGMAIANLDFDLITKRKRMMDSVGHYSRPDLFTLLVDKSPRSALTDSTLDLHAHADTRHTERPILEKAMAAL
ncbi:MAG: Nit6803 family nitriliase [Verrucomicrobia bacterium]|nr:MAG: Nit6803 family nitriliase [Verrucomicrobiota bacterium]